jgi:hypothetical protein
MDGPEGRQLRDSDIETMPPEPGVTSPLDDVREEEEGMEPAAVAPGSERDDAGERPSAAERTGSTDSVDADTHDEPSIESSGTVDAHDAVDPRADDGDDSGDDAGDDVDGTDEVDDTDGTDEGDDSGDDTGDDVDGTDEGDDTGDDSDGTDDGGDAHDADDADSEDVKTDRSSGDS